MPLTNGSESGSRNRFPAAFYHQSSNAKTTSFLYTFCLLLQGYVHIEVKEPQHNRYQGSLLFCIMIEGSGSGLGSGSIPLINGSRSGSRRPKTHVDAADSDPVFGSGSATLFYRKPFSGSKTRIFFPCPCKKKSFLSAYFLLCSVLTPKSCKEYG
jgi:hypothetical protein